MKKSPSLNVCKSELVGINNEEEDMAISTDHKDNNKEGQEQEQAAAVFSWRFDSLTLNPCSSHQSQWLQSTLSDLEKRKEAMLKIMKDDGDSFARLVDMYYNKRLELVDMVDDLYESYRS